MTPNSIRAGLQFYQSAVGKNPNYAAAYAEIAQCYMLLSAVGEMPAADATLEAEKSWGASQQRIAALQKDADGIKGLLRERIFLNKSPEGQRSPDPYDIAHDYVVLGDKDETHYWLEKVYRVRDLKFPYIRRDPACEIVRDHPRFVALMKRAGIPQ